jgi:hypothetical protein
MAHIAPIARTILEGLAVMIPALGFVAVLGTIRSWLMRHS